MATLSSQVASASRMFLVALGAPTTDPMVKAVGAWLLAESGGHIVGNNPWNLHSWGGLPGQTGYRYAGPGDKNVAVFATLQAGCTASAMNLERLAPSYGYGTVISAARSGSAIAFLDALASSSWSAGHYGGAGPTNRLRKIYASLGGALPPVVPGHEGGPAPAPGASSSGGVVQAVFAQPAFAPQCTQVTILAPANPGIETRVIPIPRESIADACTVCPTGWSEGVYTVGPIQFLQGFVPPVDLPPGTRNACFAPGVKVGDRPFFDQAGDSASLATAAVGQAIASLPAAFGNIGAHLVILVVILALIVLGLRAVVDGSPG